jgi:hypothetical protein
MLFPNEPLNDTDDVVPTWARARLTARQLGKGANGAARFSWDMVLDEGYRQGAPGALGYGS